MGVSLKPRHLKRYKDLVVLFVKYGRADLVQQSGLESVLGEPLPENGAGPTAADAVQLTDDLEKLGPTFIKVGQFLSTRPDLLPASYLEALTRLQNRVEPFPFEEVEAIVSEELGTRLSKAFESFDPKPVAAASLGQVHAACLRDGRPVAVKVQRPNIRGRILEDLEALDQVAEYLDAHTEAGRRYGFQPMLDEFRKALLAELDYRLEARNLATLGENLRDFPLIVVPAPVEDYVTHRVLTMDFIRGRKVTSVSPVRRLELNGGALAEELCRAYLHQTLVDGFFHADPHPGNVFLTEDGRLALLDLGMVARLGPEMQEHLLRLLLAVSEGRSDDAATLMIRIGQTAERFDEGAFRSQASDLVLNVRNRSVSDFQQGRVLLEIARIAADHSIRVPRELTMLGKALLNIDRVATHIDPEFDPSASIRRNAIEIAQRRMRKRLSPARLVSGLLEMTDFAERLPQRLNAMVDAVARNDFRIRVDAIDEVTLMVGIQKVANRIALGLVLAALIVGAALLMPVETDFRIFGYPGLAILLFMTAAIAGFGLILSIALHDFRERKTPRNG